ncbi:MAG: VOC family protein [Fidelibacterota bacterium]
MEYFVNNVEDARYYLEAKGCKVIKWEGKGKDCYMQDPFGLTFNLWEEKKD